MIKDLVNPILTQSSYALLIVILVQSVGPSVDHGDRPNMDIGFEYDIDIGEHRYVLEINT